MEAVEEKNLFVHLVSFLSLPLQDGVGQWR